jgi:hypothetical protein
VFAVILCKAAGDKGAYRTFCIQLHGRGGPIFRIFPCVVIVAPASLSNLSWEIILTCLLRDFFLSVTQVLRLYRLKIGHDRIHHPFIISAIAIVLASPSFNQETN